eukprot:GHVS01079114.1.p2 GENE.GHVS01079114.1~~GHVS01079114.1.p2  ORF type:complete len:128 (+),score=43.38 GHVS01079114.1:1039-1422(+)
MDISESSIFSDWGSSDSSGSCFHCCRCQLLPLAVASTGSCFHRQLLPLPVLLLHTTKNRLVPRTPSSSRSLHFAIATTTTTTTTATTTTTTTVTTTATTTTIPTTQHIYIHMYMHTTCRSQKDARER